MSKSRPVPIPAGSPSASCCAVRDQGSQQGKVDVCCFAALREELRSSQVSWFGIYYSIGWLARRHDTPRRDTSTDDWKRMEDFSLDALFGSLQQCVVWLAREG